ncbi:hypothetical protein T439DRAFT_383323 [Meredithblackwellia eburnea MCA 4105]
MDELASDVDLDSDNNPGKMSFGHILCDPASKRPRRAAAPLPHSLNDSNYAAQVATSSYHHLNNDTIFDLQDLLDDDDDQLLLPEVDDGGLYTKRNRKKPKQGERWLKDSLAKHAARRPLNAPPLTSTGSEDAAALQEGSEPFLAYLSTRTSPNTKSSKALSDKQRKSGRLGRLSTALTGLPIEMLSEILSHSTPATLLRLSRVAKVFRRLLFTKSSRPIWLRAFENDGFAEQFQATDFNEPTIARLIWDKECWICGRQKVHKIIWSLRARYCDVCLKSQLLPKHELDIQMREFGPLHPAVWACTPVINRPPWSYAQVHGEFYISWALKQQNQKLLQLKALDESDPLPPAEPEPEAPVCKSEQDSPATPAPTTTAAAAGTTGGEGGGGGGETTNEAIAVTPTPVPNTRVAKFVAFWTDNRPKMEKDSRMLDEWQKALDKSRADSKISLQKERADAIMAHLTADGFDEVDIVAGLAPGAPVYSFIDQPYPLTDRVWRKIGPVLKEHLANVRREREAEAANKRKEAENAARRLQVPGHDDPYGRGWKPAGWEGGWDPLGRLSPGVMGNPGQPQRVSPGPSTSQQPQPQGQPSRALPLPLQIPTGSSAPLSHITRPSSSSHHHPSSMPPQMPSSSMPSHTSMAPHPSSIVAPPIHAPIAIPHPASIPHPHSNPLAHPTSLPPPMANVQVAVQQPQMGVLTADASRRLHDLLGTFYASTTNDPQNRHLQQQQQHHVRPTAGSSSSSSGHVGHQPQSSGGNPGPSSGQHYGQPY